MKSTLIKKISACRVCNKNDFTKVLSLGPTPLANAFLTEKQVDQEEYFYPLDLYFCNNCTFLTLGHVVSPQVLFGNYVYVSSTSSVFIKHFEDMVEKVMQQYHLGNSLVIDIGSNDGILLKPFKKHGSRILGIEPAQEIATVAKKEGIPTISEFFSVSLAKKIVKKNGKAKLITATNVFAHIDNLDEVIEGLKILLSDDGIFMLEAPYLVDFLEKKYFDLVYHEHLSYWAIVPLIKLFKRFDMTVFDVQKVPVHGGSIRVFVKKTDGPHKIQKNVTTFLDLEKKRKLGQVNTYLNFGTEILENKSKLTSLLVKLKVKGARIGGYGAPAKGNTLLNFFGIGQEFLEYIVDDSPWKQGLYSPGKRIPVVSSKKLYKDPVDYLLILAWNFAGSIMVNHNKFAKTGGRFIIPVPELKIV